MKVQSYRDLEAWQLAMDTADVVYRVSDRFPREELFGLTSQVRRAAVSAPSNIAEGHARRSLRAYLNHLGIALGSLAELDTELEIAERRHYGRSEAFAEARTGLSRTRQTIHGLRRSLETRMLASFGTFAGCILFVFQCTAS
jgi:four helix bundle protein